MATLTPEAPEAPRSTSGRHPVPPRPAPHPHVVATWAIFIGLLAMCVWSAYDLGINPVTIFERLANGVDFLSRLVPPEFPEPGRLIELTLTTLAIVFLATLFSVVTSVPIAIFAAVNTTTGMVSRQTARIIMIFCRAAPDLVFAIILIRVFGPANGALIGIIAMGLSSIGMVGKLLADNIEDVNRGPSEAIQAAGGARWQWIHSTVIPQILPQIIAHGLHRMDINLRNSVLLGFVGVPGIGAALSTAMNTRQWQLVMGLAIIITVLCIFMELLSGAIRTQLMGRDGSGRRRGILGVIDRIAHNNWVTAPTETHQVQRTRNGAVRTSPQWDAGRIQRFFGWLVLIGLVVAAVWDIQINWQVLTNTVTNFPEVVSRFFPPDGRGLYWDRFFPALVETVQIGFASLLLGLFIALPIGAMAARNVAPTPGIAKFFRIVIVVCRAFPELVLAIILVVILGFNATAGVLALAFGSIGLLSKLVADSLEESDTRVQDAVRASGANRLQTFFAATVRQTAPATIAHILYQLDVNIRAATLLGVLGLGIGFDLLEASTRNRYDILSLIILNILAVVVVLELISMYVRKVVR
ncbi:phosphonate ABC transporter, permease protein PhnE [Nesterenkonia alkaliphila]|uniref:Phosphonate ABC transporter, permease protein PhnE n=1 Tax=Nesterenkonia alkaliphila TaxID=1463631 RepID=A0A7K1UGU4_9MICC|nr:phosphonate ABC transporter, permease protein PhnE [Nesterenkonia alkaliphila]MVT25606.1 phosphonate ABC transporter, permease protein PhnE [Nesterenkonia alkaliphila]GFZ77627.1 phosphate-import permease protein PhnE [Nesterenkonia alkaliphila]